MLALGFCALAAALAACNAPKPNIREGDADSVQISYGGGSFYNGEPRQFARRTGPQGQIRLDQHEGLVLDLPAATEAVVPQRPYP